MQKRQKVPEMESYPLETERRLNLHKTFRRRLGRLFMFCVQWDSNNYQRDI